MNDAVDNKVSKRELIIKLKMLRDEFHYLKIPDMSHLSEDELQSEYKRWIGIIKEDQETKKHIDELIKSFLNDDNVKEKIRAVYSEK